MTSEPEYVVVRSEPWPADHMARLDRMLTMAKGWDSYDADPPSPAAVANAREFVTVATDLGLPPDRVTPTCMGGVAVTFREGDERCVQAFVEFYNRGTAYALFSHNADEEMHTLQVTTDHQGYVQFLCLLQFLFKIAR